MTKFKKGMRFVWKNNRAWLLVSCITLAFFFIVSMVATQQVFLRNTISTVMGGDRRYLIDGEPSKYEHYKADSNGFIYYEPSENLPNTSIFDISSGEAKNAKADTLAEANMLNEQMVEEGIVLLKNKNNALPMETVSSAKLKVSVFGKNSVNLVYGGSGSGGGKTAGAKTIFDSLAAANYEVNPTLRKFYENTGASGKGRSSNPSMGEKVVGLSTGETPQNSYTTSVKDSYKNYNAAAIVVFSRIGGEGFDLPQSMKNTNGTAIAGANATDHYLQLDNNERALLDAVCTAGFGKVIVVINSSTSMELGFLDENAKIDAALWLGSPGKTGVMALGKVLNGTANPSGRLVDTYARNFKDDPTWVNFAFNGIPGDKNSPAGNEYLDMTGGKSGEYYVDYAEGIYVGYRYYETRAFEMRRISEDTAVQWYQNNVIYPFGYGLSYTDFKWEIVNADKNGDNATTPNGTISKDGKITVNVKVTNKGSRAGMDVVQLYYTAPYNFSTTKRVEKAHVVLGDFAKTKILAKDESEIVTLEINAFDMASYDYAGRSLVNSGESGYKLDSGSYKISIGENAHASWAGTGRADSSTALTKTFTVPSGGYAYDKDPNAGGKIDNRYDDLTEYIEGRKLLSRNQLFMNINFDTELRSAESTRMKDLDFFKSLKYTVNDKETDPWYVSEDKMPIYGADKDSAKLYELISYVDGKVFVDYNDARWNDILDRFTIAEMSNLIGTGNFNTAFIGWLDKPKTTDPDGPAGFTNFMGDPTVYDTCYYASECVIAATWNKLLVHDMGVMVGLEGIWGNQRGDGRPYTGWYAPALNIHRSPFSGRNFEYYSEDPYLSGILGASVVQGAKKKGVYNYIKHFALNDMETDRGGICTWADEQTIREIYLKPFEIAVKKGQTTGVMSSFNRIGTEWAGGSYTLLTEILRDEWGFKGMVISDYNTYAHMPADQMIRAGGDLNLIQDKQPTIKAAALTATQVTAMRNATKNILYTVANSNAMNGVGEGVVWGYKIPSWVVMLTWANIALLVIFGVWGVFAIRGKLKKVKASK